MFMSSAAEIYKIRETYERFNQRMEMFCRSIWDQEFAETLGVPNYVKALLGRAVEQIQSKRPGHSLREMALCWASWTIAAMDDMGQGGEAVTMVYSTGSRWGLAPGVILVYLFGSIVRRRGRGSRTRGSIA